MNGGTVSVANVTSRLEADLIVGMLRSQGLRAASVTDDAGGQEPQLQLQGGVRVLVALSDEPTARRLLAAADRSATDGAETSAAAAAAVGTGLGHPGQLAELLPAVDVVRGAGERGVDHEMHGERRNILRYDDASDGERGAKLLPPLLEAVADGRAPVPPMSSRVPPGRTAAGAWRATSRTSPRCPATWRRAAGTSISASVA